MKTIELTKSKQTDLMHVIVSTPSGNLLGESRTLADADAARDQYVTLNLRNTEAREIVFDDGRDDAPTDRELPRAS